MIKITFDNEELIDLDEGMPSEDELREIKAKIDDTDDIDVDYVWNWEVGKVVDKVKIVILDNIIDKVKIMLSENVIIPLKDYIVMLNMSEKLILFSNSYHDSVMNIYSLDDCMEIIDLAIEEGINKESAGICRKDDFLANFCKLELGYSGMLINNGEISLGRCSININVMNTAMNEDNISKIGSTKIIDAIRNEVRLMNSVSLVLSWN